MKIDLDLTVQSVEISTSGYRDFVNAEIHGVEVGDVISEIETTVLFAEIDLDDYIDWADSSGKTSEILYRLAPDEVITWLRVNGHLEGENA
ncbi:hypothetical protein ACP3TG_09150 [Phytobacter diazotrophicus]